MTKLDLPPYECNVCKKRRDQDVNHWLVLLPCTNGVLISRWCEKGAEQRDAVHACGEDHATVLFSRWLATGNFEEKR